MEAIAGQHRGAEFEVFTTVPEWFLRESLNAPFRRHAETVDVGLVQRGPLHEDMEATAAAVAKLLDPRSGHVASLASAIRHLNCAAAIADIAPLGLAAATAAGVPGVLVENFTWDWIYAHHPRAPESLRRHGEAIARMNATASLHLQSAPVCQPAPGAVQVGPIARRPRLGRAAMRRHLRMADDERLALVSLGGIPVSLAMPTRVPPSCKVLMLGASEVTPAADVRGLPHRSGLYHPDLACAADVIVGKLGYSTLAEAWQADCGLVWVQRPDFPETAVLASHAGDVLRHAEISANEFAAGAWAEHLDRLAPARRPEPFADGGSRAAQAILQMLGTPTR